MSVNRAPALAAGAVRLFRDPGVRFGVVFLLLFAALYGLLGGSGPVEALNRLVGALTLAQAEAAAFGLRLLGQSVERQGALLLSPAFTCEVGEGCNGMVAVTLALAGVLAYPVSWRRRIAGIAALLPAILLVNIVRIGALWFVGRHRPEFFDAAHVYVGQVFVIVLTAAFWWLWLTWRPETPTASS
jgi:exosortase/archaeosortase family protein